MRISTQIRPYFYHRAKARYTTSWASSSNGQSTGLLIQGLWVRIPRGLPLRYPSPGYPFSPTRGYTSKAPAHIGHHTPFHNLVISIYRKS